MRSTLEDFLGCEKERNNMEGFTFELKSLRGPNADKNMRGSGC
jgi:hypothetical protein